MKPVKTAKQDGRQLPANTLETIRRQAVARVLAGESPETVVRELGFHRSRIYAWLKAYRLEGEAGLRAKPTAMGRPRNFSSADHQRLISSIAGKTPRHLGLDGNLWSSENFQVFLHKKFSAEPSKSALSRLLKQLGLGERRLKRRLEQRSALYDHWLRDEYPRIQQLARDEKAAVYLCSVCPCPVNTENKTNAYFLVANSSRGELFFRLYPCLPTDSECAQFIRQLAKTTQQKLFLIGRDKPFSDPEFGRVERTLKKIVTWFYLPLETHHPFSQQEDFSLKKSLAASPNVFPALTDMESWILLLNQSVLDPQHPLSEFITILNRYANGAAFIATNLYNPGSLIRALYEGENLSHAIARDKGVTRSWHTNPFLSVLKKPGDVVRMSEIVPKKDWPKDFYCKDALVAADMEDAIAMGFSGPENTLCGLFMHRRFLKQPFDDSTKEFLRSLRPHLELALRVVIRHWHTSYTVRALAEATRHLDIAAILVDGRGKIISYNTSAWQLFNNESRINIVNQGIRFSSHEHQKIFDEALQRSIDWRQEPIGDRPTETLRFNLSQDDWLGVLIRAIPPDSMRIPHSAAVSPHVVVYISDPSKPHHMEQHQLIAKLFQLTEREALLTTLIINGHSIDESASKMGITEASARTYLQHVYEKVGVNRRQDLVQRVTKSVALLA